MEFRRSGRIGAPVRMTGQFWPQRLSGAGGTAVAPPAFEKIQDAANVVIVGLEAPEVLLEESVVLLETAIDLIEVGAVIASLTRRGFEPPHRRHGR